MIIRFKKSKKQKKEEVVANSNKIVGADTKLSKIFLNSSKNKNQYGTNMVRMMIIDNDDDDDDDDVVDE